MVWRPMLFGAGPLFPFAVNPVLPWWGLIICVCVGLVAGLQSGLLTRLLYATEDLFERLRNGRSHALQVGGGQGLRFPDLIGALHHLQKYDFNKCVCPLFVQ